MTPTITVECLSCNARSEADGIVDTYPQGDWRCPECGGHTAVPAAGESNAGP